MKRNTFFARFLVTNSDIENEGEGYVVEQYFTTNELYVIEPPSARPLNPVEKELETAVCVGDLHIVDTSNGLLIPADDVVESGWDAGYLTVGFDVIEDGTEFPTLENLRVVSITRGGSTTNNAQVLQKYFVAAYAIGTIEDQGSINTSALNQDNTVWIIGTSKKVRGTLKPRRLRSNKFANTVAFAHPFYLPDPHQPMEDYQFVGVYQEPGGETDDCCTSQNHSSAINAAAILVASNNATTPVLIKKIEDAVSNNFDLPSTLSALQSMRQLGTLSNMTGKVLDNLVRKDIDTDFNIKNGKEAE